jgi:hypothetical protein
MSAIPELENVPEVDTVKPAPEQPPIAPVQAVESIPEQPEVTQSGTTVRSEQQCMSPKPQGTGQSTSPPQPSPYDTKDPPAIIIPEASHGHGASPQFSFTDDARLLS